MSYTLTQKEFSTLKRRLTTRQNKWKKAEALLRAKSHDRDLQADVVFHAKQLKAEAEYALNIFAEKGYPDAWHRWENAKDDAAFAIQRNQRDSHGY